MEKTEPDRLVQVIHRVDIKGKPRAAGDDGGVGHLGVVKREAACPEAEFETMRCAKRERIGPCAMTVRRNRDPALGGSEKRVEISGFEEREIGVDDQHRPRANLCPGPLQFHIQPRALVGDPLHPAHRRQSVRKGHDPRNPATVPQGVDHMVEQIFRQFLAPSCAEMRCEPGFAVGRRLNRHEGGPARHRRKVCANESAARATRARSSNVSMSISASAWAIPGASSPMLISRPSNISP